MTKKLLKALHLFECFYFKQICPAVVNSAPPNSLKKIKKGLGLCFVNIHITCQISCYYKNRSVSISGLGFSSVDITFIKYFILQKVLFVLVFYIPEDM